MSTTIADQNEGKHSKTHGAIKPWMVLSFTSDWLRSHHFSNHRAKGSNIMAKLDYSQHSPKNCFI